MPVSCIFCLYESIHKQTYNNKFKTHLCTDPRIYQALPSDSLNTVYMSQWFPSCIYSVLDTLVRPCRAYCEQPHINVGNTRNHHVLHARTRCETAQTSITGIPRSQCRQPTKTRDQRRRAIRLRIDTACCIVWFRLLLEYR